MLNVPNARKVGFSIRPARRRRIQIWRPIGEPRDASRRILQPLCVKGDRHEPCKQKHWESFHAVHSYTNCAWGSNV